MSRILSIDYGDKRVGVALSDPLRTIAKPFKTISCSSVDDLVLEIKEIVNQNDVSKIVVGLPLTLKGKFSDQTNKVLSFVDFLKKKISITIDTYDERLSSIQAKRSLIQQGIKTGYNKDSIDQTAAAIFLQGYLDKYDKTK